MSAVEEKARRIHEIVRAAYGMVAKSKKEASTSAACCAPAATIVSDYTPEELAEVPAGAYLEEGSGAPVRFLNLRAGEAVVDLGAGAGMDSFLAARRVGPRGRVYGFDLTPEMVERARHNAAEAGDANVAFQVADIAHLPLPDGSADAAISNCVINLTPDKGAVYADLYRVLRPGGRLSVSDIVLRGNAADISALRELANPASWCACLMGALEESEYFSLVRSAGFTDLVIAAERAAQSQPDGNVRAVALTFTARKPA